MTLVKICGLREESDVAAAIDSGADRLGFVLVRTSPRAVPVASVAKFSRMAREAGREAWLVASAATAAEARLLAAIVEDTPDITAVQLHNRETPEQVAAFQEDCPAVRIIKAAGIETRADLDALSAFTAADGFLLDAKPPRGADREGGFGHAFDWTLLKDFSPRKRWVLSGGLTVDTVVDAIRISGARAVDVSSGVEVSPGVKDHGKIRAFIEAAKSATPA
jgi:phosphoribosylanthranilate isomerase